MSEYFPEIIFFGRKVKFKLGFSNYATKSELKNVTGFDTSTFA